MISKNINKYKRRYAVHKTLKTSTKLKQKRIAILMVSLALIFSAFVGIFNTVPASAAISQAQTPATATCGGSGSCNASPTISAATANNLLIVVCSAQSQTGSPSFSVSGYTSANTAAINGGVGVEVFYKVAAGSETTATCAITGTNSVKGVASMHEYSGTATSSPLDVAGNNTGSGTSLSSASINTTHRADLIIAGFSTGTSTTFSGWTDSFTEQTDANISNPGGNTQSTADRIVNGKSSYSTTATAGSNGAWATQIVAFKDDGTTPPPTTELTLEGYIFENDDGSAADTNTQLAGSEFSSGKTLTGVRRGERITLRAHISNTGLGAIETSDELALFYDRNDGIWSRVNMPGIPDTSSGSGCGTGASAAFSCTQIHNGLIEDSGRFSDLAVSPDGTMWSAFTSDDSGSDGNVIVAQYVGNGLGDCDTVGQTGGSDDWDCWIVYAGNNGSDGEDLSFTFHPDGTPWLAFRDNSTGSDLYTAEYVGDGTGDCDTLGDATGSDDWDCTVVYDGDDNDDAQDNDIAIASDGTIWTYFNDENSAGTDGNAYIAKYVGGGSGDCDTVGGTGGSADWDCDMVYDGNSDDDGRQGALAIGDDDQPILVFKEQITNDSRVTVAEYIGTTGQDCDSIGGTGGSDLWDCTVVWGGDSTSDGDAQMSIAIGPNGNPWVAFRDESTTDITMVAEYIGTSGQDCDTVGDANGSDFWDCTAVYEGSSLSSFYTDINFSPDGTPWIVFTDQLTNDGQLIAARFVGGNTGDCDTVGGASGSDNWECLTVYDGANTDDGLYAEMVFDGQGHPWISVFVDATGDGQHWLATTNRAREITIAPGQAASTGDALSESHADMTSETNTANRDDADCLVSGSWNNGIWTSGSIITGLSLPAGDATTQCTEIAWTIDTSQAQIGQTYRFMIASNDTFNLAKNSWKGPISVAADGYPTLAIAADENNTYYYSKSTLRGFDTDCDDTSWECSTITATSSLAPGTEKDLAISPDGRPFIVGHDPSVSKRDLELVEYVGSGGTGCANARWNCVAIDGTGGPQVGEDPKIIFTERGIPWIQYQGSYLSVARYVGSGGSCPDSSAWDCTDIDTNSGVARYADIAAGPNGEIAIAYIDGTNNNLNYAEYVGTGGAGCATGITDWTCYKVADIATDGPGEIGIVLDHAGNPWITYVDAGAADDVMVARYIGSGGTGCTSEAWECKDIYDNNVTLGGDIVVDGDGDVWITFWRPASNGVFVAEYVGTGGSGCAAGVSDWTCVQVESGDFRNPSMAVDANGNPWISYIDNTNDDLIVAEYVGSGGSGCTSAAWQCHDVDTTSTIGPTTTGIAFSPDGTPWVAYSVNDGNTELGIAKMKLPPHRTAINDINHFDGTNATGAAQLSIPLDSGVSPYTDLYGDCTQASLDNGYCSLYHPEGFTDEVAARTNERPIYQFSTRFSSNTVLPTAMAHFKTDRAPSTTGSEADVVLQVYRYGTTNAWEDVKTDSSSTSCSSDNCVIQGNPTGTASEYFETDGSNYWVHFRLYQVESPTVAINFGLDSVRITQPQEFLRHGGVFREEALKPFGW